MTEARCRSILRKSWVGHLMDGCRDVPPGSLVRLYYVVRYEVSAISAPKLRR